MYVLLLTSVLLHPVHETVSEVEWNEKTKRLEVALRLDPLDEQWLKQKVGGGDKLEQWAPKYLRRKFRIADVPDTHENKPVGGTKPEDGGKVSRRPIYHWIGRDDKRSHVWWYFEIEPADHKRPKWIDQRILFERHGNYVNRILVLDHSPRLSLTLTLQRPQGSLERPNNESVESKPDSGSRLDRR